MQLLWQSQVLIKLTNLRPRSPTKLIDVAEEWGSSGRKRTGGGDHSQMRKNLKFASDSVQTGALDQNTPIVRDDNLEGKEERGNALSKEMGAGLGAGDMDERLVGENVFHSTGVETVETIGPVYSTMSFIVDYLIIKLLAGNL